MRLLVLFPILCFSALAALGQSGGLSPEEARTYDDVLGAVMNPCPAEHTTVKDSNPTCEYANRIRAEVRGMVKSGMGREAIMSAMVERYGREILAEPEGGWRWVSRLVPLAVLLLAGAGISVMLHVWKRRGTPPGPTAVAPNEALHRRIEEELLDLRNS